MATISLPRNRAINKTKMSIFPIMHLPEEIVLHILSKLSPKYLLRLKCVCKSWHSLIDTQFLIQTLLLPKNPHSHLPTHYLIKRREKTNNDHVFSLISYRTLEESSETLELPYPEFTEIIEEMDIQILGSCNGMLCLHEPNYDRIVLWTPATGETRVVPHSHVSNPPGTTLDRVGPDVGFGYDASTNDYKVVRFGALWYKDDKAPRVFKVEVYSLRADCWRGIDGVVVPAFAYPDPSHRAMTMACADGMFLWWAHRRDDYYGNNILWFLIQDEMFGTIAIPDACVLVGDRCSSHDVHRYWRHILVLNDHCNTIAMVVFPDFEMSVEKCFHIWVMLEFAVEQSWAKLYTVGPLAGIERPLWFWKNGELFMENGNGELVLYNLFTREMRNLKIDGVPKSLQVVPTVQEGYMF